MAYYALLNKDNMVVTVISGVDENIIQTDSDGKPIGGSSEAWESFYANLPWFAGLTCKRTSYNTFGGRHTLGGTPFRGNFAGIGFKYDVDFDVFIAPQPYPSFKLNYETFLWEPPYSPPEEIDDNHIWKWSEYNKEWIKATIPQD